MEKDDWLKVPRKIEQWIDAIEEGDTRKVRELADAGMDVNAPLIPRMAGYDCLPLGLAKEAEDVDMVRTLLELGADPNKPHQELGRFHAYPLLDEYVGAVPKIEMKKLLKKFGAKTHRELIKEHVSEAGSAFEHLAGNRLAEAAAYFEAVLKKHPYADYACLNLADLYRELGRPEEAERAMLHYTRYCMDTPEAFLFAAEYYWKRNPDQLPFLKRQLRNLLRRTVGASIISNYSQALMNFYCGNLEVAVRSCLNNPRLLGVILAHAPEFTEIAVSGEAKQFMRDVPLTCFEKAIAAEPNDPINYHNKAQRLVELGRRAEGIRCLEFAVRKFPLRNSLKYPANRKLVRNLQRMKNEQPVEYLFFLYPTGFHEFAREYWGSRKWIPEPDHKPPPEHFHTLAVIDSTNSWKVSWAASGEYPGHYQGYIKQWAGRLVAKFQKAEQSIMVHYTEGDTKLETEEPVPCPEIIVDLLKYPGRFQTILNGNVYRTRATKTEAGPQEAETRTTLRYDPEQNILIMNRKTEELEQWLSM